jgi:hypothetical protein
MVEAAELARGTLARRNQLRPALAEEPERVDEGVEKTADGNESGTAIGSAL